MTKILFICHGNICRSVAAEMVMKQLIRERSITWAAADSAAATREEIGNDIYPPMKKALKKREYVCEVHAARQTEKYGFLKMNDSSSLRIMHRFRVAIGPGK